MQSKAFETGMACDFPSDEDPTPVIVRKRFLSRAQSKWKTYLHNVNVTEADDNRRKR